MRRRLLWLNIFDTILIILISTGSWYIILFYISSYCGKHFQFDMIYFYWTIYIRPIYTIHYIFVLISNDHCRAPKAERSFLVFPIDFDAPIIWFQAESPKTSNRKAAHMTYESHISRMNDECTLLQWRNLARGIQCLGLNIQMPSAIVKVIVIVVDWEPFVLSVASNPDESSLDWVSTM